MLATRRPHALLPVPWSGMGEGGPRAWPGIRSPSPGDLVHPRPRCQSMGPGWGAPMESPPGPSPARQAVSGPHTICPWRGTICVHNTGQCWVPRPTRGNAGCRARSPGRPLLHPLPQRGATRSQEQLCHSWCPGSSGVSGGAVLSRRGGRYTLRARLGGDGRTRAVSLGFARGGLRTTSQTAGAFRVEAGNPPGPAGLACSALRPDPSDVVGRSLPGAGGTPGAAGGLWEVLAGVGGSWVPAGWSRVGERR